MTPEIVAVNFEPLTDWEIRQYAAALISAATGNPATWYVNSAALAAYDGYVGMRRKEDYGAVGFTPITPIDDRAAARLMEAQSCFRWGY